MKIDPKVEEAVETLNMKDGPTRRRLLGGAGLVSASAAAAALLAACSSSTPASSAAKGAVGNFPKTPAWQFWYVNHVTTNPFFVPTQYGFQDAAALLGLPTPKWGGSQNSLASEMVELLQHRHLRQGGRDRLRRDRRHSFTAPVENAMNAGIPVLSYNADGLVKKGVPDIGTNRLAYVGQALYISGQQLGNQIKQLIPAAARSPSSSPRPGPATSSPATTARCRCSAAQLYRARGRHWRGDRPGTVGREGVPDRAQDDQGRVRGGRGLDRAARPGAGLDRPDRSRTAGSTPRRPRCPTSRPARPTSPSTRTPTCRASCRPCTSTCTTSRAARSARPTPTPA